MIMHWPEGLGEEAGTMRKQFVNVSDVTPTLYELLGITPPEVYRGVPQLPLTGHSFRSILDDADAASVNTLQYFENSGSRALVTEIDGVWWKGVTKHNQGDDFDTEPWELYRLADDPSELHDLAEVEPEMLATVVDLWWREAERNGVLPLDDRGFELFSPRPSDHSPHRPNRRYVYRPPISPVPSQPSAAVGGRAFDLIAQVTVESGDEGVLWATGNENSGFSIFVQDGKLVADYNSFNTHTIVESSIEVPAGDVELRVHLERDSRTTGFCEIAINGEVCGRGDIGFYMRMVSSVGSSLGRDHGSAVSDRYSAPFAFTGTLHEVVIQLPPRRSDSETKTEAAAEMSRQ
jgi:arylsulfatase